MWVALAQSNSSDRGRKRPFQWNAKAPASGRQLLRTCRPIAEEHPRSGAKAHAMIVRVGIRVGLTWRVESSEGWRSLVPQASALRDGAHAQDKGLVSKRSSRG